MKKFRWAYAGSGSIAGNTARSITRGNHTIAAVYSRNREKAREFAGRYGAQIYESFDYMLSEGGFDGVYIATPHTAHLEYSLAAMKAGYPVLCEKPVGVSAEQAEMMIKASYENGVYFCEAMWTWFSDLPYAVKDAIERGEIGKVKKVKILYAFPGLLMSKNSRLLMPETAGGALLDIGVYPITYCYRLFGYPQSIRCRGRIRNGIDTGETVTLGYDGFECVLEMSLSKLGESCRIKGTEGEINIPVFHMARTAVIKSGGKRRTLTGRTDYITEFTRTAQEIQAGKTDSVWIPHSATLDCLKIMDECRGQMGLVYPFEK